MTPDDHTAPTILASNIRQKSEQLISLAKTRPRVSAVQSASDLAAGLDSKIWNREREAQLKLFRFAREFKNAVNQYGSLAQFPQELFDKLSSMISFESLSDEALKYALGFIVLNARTESEYVMDERGRFPFNLVLYIALQRSGISYQELHQNNRAQSRLIGLVGDHYAMENLMRTIHGENHPLADADQYYSRQIQVKISQDSGKQNQFEKEFTDLLKLFRSRPILFPDIAEKYYGNDGSSQIIVLDRFKSQFEEEFYLSPAKYIEGLTELLRDDLILSPDRLETIADFYDQTQNMPHCPGEDRGKVRRFQLEDGRWVYAKRVALLRVRHPAEEIRKAIQVDEALRELRPQYRAQEFIGVVYDQGNFYLLSLGVLAERTVLDLEQKPPELARIEQILRDAGVGHPEGLIRWKQMLVQDDGGIRIIDFETLPSPRELAMNRPDSVRQEQDIIREQERAYADFPGKPEKTGQEGSGGTEFITALFLATGAAIALLASHQAGAAELSRGVLGLFGSSNMIWGAVLGTFALLGIKEIFFQVELLDEATIVHETAHILFPEADHEVIEAMGLVRTKEVFFDQFFGSIQRKDCTI
ncbi:MAG: hypothetical protein HYS07_02160 [Chlamydiae bacterium]|nr:hypothetical protein [Chlamydiota bacterium]